MAEWIPVQDPAKIEVSRYLREVTARLFRAHIPLVLMAQPRGVP